MSRTWILALLALVGLIGAACGDSKKKPSDTCNCPTPEHALSTCLDNVCAFTCVEGYQRSGESCVAKSPDTVTSCGKDQRDCTQQAHVVQTSCVSGVCAPSACVAGFHLATGSCEADTVTSCGADKADCTQQAHVAETACVGGLCVPSSCASEFHLASGACGADSDLVCGNALSDCTVLETISTCVAGACAERVCASNEHATREGCLRNDVTACGLDKIDCTKIPTVFIPCPVDDETCVFPYPHALTLDCIADACAPVACQRGFYLDEGLCLPNTDTACGSPTNDCTQGLAPGQYAACQIYDGKCVDICPPGQLRGLGGECEEIAQLCPSALGQFCVVTRLSGSVKCWGMGSHGQLGYRFFDDNAYEPMFPAGFPTATKVATGLYYSCAITAQGKVNCWGKHHASAPIDSSQDWRAIDIAMGLYEGCALTDQKTVKCWSLFGDAGGAHDLRDIDLAGRSAVGLSMYALGDVPDIVYEDEAVSKRATASAQACEISKADGTVTCSGSNDHGQLGTGTFGDAVSPVLKVVGLTGVDSIAVFDDYACALVGGAVKCWGSNGHLQLGNGTADSAIPVQVTGLESGIISISAGYNTACALSSAGQVKCWGGDQWGAAGLGSSGTNTAIPNLIRQSLYEPSDYSLLY